MKILALDLATKTGWAYRDPETNKILAGTWELATPKQLKGRNECDCDPRLPALRNLLLETAHMHIFEVFAFENVQFVQSRAQGFLWSGLRSMLWLVTNDMCIRTVCVPVKTLKKFATGNGNADKDDMALALFEKGHLAAGEGFDDNAVDAAHVLLWAEANFVFRNATLTNPKNPTP